MPRTLVLAAVCILAASPAVPQDFRSDLLGMVTDPSGLGVPDASLRLINEETGITAATTTDAEGSYQFMKLAPGRYRLEVAKAGFKNWARGPLQLEIASRRRLDVRLDIGAVQERVEVTVPAPMVNAVDASVDQVVRSKEITDLPVNGRNAYALLLLTADVQPDNPGLFANTLPRQRAERSNFSVSGSASQRNEILMDGAPNSETGKLVGYPASPDVVQEFKVQSNFDAEFGFSLGGVVNTVTKSGTNTIHGSAWEFLRNDVLQAGDFFANMLGAEPAPFRFNQFGGTVGGPVVKNKAFFFASYEGMRQRNPATFIGTMPTSRQRAGDFSETVATNGRQIAIYDPFSTRATQRGFTRDVFPGNRIPPARIDSVGNAMAGFYPLPNRPGTAPAGANNFIVTGANRENYDTILIRLDGQLTDRHRIFGRYIYAEPTGVPVNPYGNAANPNRLSQTNNHLSAVDYTYSATPTLLFDVRAAYNRFRNVGISGSKGFDLSRLMLPASYIKQLCCAEYFPTVNVADAERLGDVSVAAGGANNNYALAANVTKISGRHTLKAGFDRRFYQLNKLPGGGYAAGQFTFGRNFTQGPDPLVASLNAGHGVASLLLGTGSGSTDINEPLSNGFTDSALFINDTWRATRKLSINLGLRYDNYAPLNERFNRINRGFAFGVPSPLEAQAQANYARSPIPQLATLEVKGGLLFAGVAGVPTGLTDRDNNNFAPRLGIAYSLDARTALRVGYGLSYKRFETGNQVDQYGFSQSTPWVGSVDGITPLNLASNPYPGGLLQPVGSSLGLLTSVGQGIGLYETRARTPYAHSYEASLQREVGSNVLVEGAYVGNSSQKWIVDRQLDALPARFLELQSGLSRSVPNPFYGLIKTGTLSARTIPVSQLLTPFPHFTSFAQSEHIGQSWYHSMRVKVEKRFSSGFGFLASYRVSKLMGKNGFLNSSDDELEQVLGAADSPQRLVISGLWQLPFGRQRIAAAPVPARLVRTFFGGWQLNWIATFNRGFPIGGFANGMNLGRSARVEKPTVDRWFDTSAFALLPPFTLRTLSSRLPDTRRDGVKNFDLSLLKDLRATERIAMQLRFEAFNAFNTPLFGAPATNVGAATFGQVRSQANSPREIQVALKILW